MQKIAIFTLLFINCLSAWNDSLIGSISGYLTPSDVDIYIQTIKSSFISTENVTISAFDNAIKCHKYTEGGNTHIDSASKPSILLTSGLNSLQPLAPTMSLYILGYLLSAKSSNPEYAFLLNSTNIYTIPMININAFTNISKSNTLTKFKKNLILNCATNPGVDLTKNFGFQFGVNAPQSDSDNCSDTFQGISAASEKETSGLQSYIANKNVQLWIHFDEVGDNFTIPWSYSSNLTNYGSTELNSAYKKLIEDLEEQGASIGNSFSQIGVSRGGGLIDYGLSQKIFTVQSALPAVEGNASLAVCEQKLPSMFKLLGLMTGKLQLTYGNNSIEEISNSSSVARAIMSFNLTNDGMIDRTVIFSLYSNTSGVKLSIANSTLGGKFVNLTSFVLPGFSELTLTLNISVISNTSVSSFETTAKIAMVGSDKSSALAYINPGPISAKVPSTYVSPTGFFLRSWYISGSHHEGAAVGLVSALFVIISVLVLLYIYSLYKKDPGEAAGEEGMESSYVIKEVQVAKRTEINLAEAQGRPDNKGSIPGNPDVKAEIRVPFKPENKVPIQAEIKAPANEIIAAKAFGKPSFEANFSSPQKPKDDPSKFSIKEDLEDNPQVIKVPKIENISTPKTIVYPNEQPKPLDRSQANLPPPVPISMQNSTLEQPKPLDRPQLNLPPPVPMSMQNPTFKVGAPDVKPGVIEPKMIPVKSGTNNRSIVIESSDSDSSNEIEIISGSNKNLGFKRPVRDPGDDHEFLVQKMPPAPNSLPPPVPSAINVTPGPIPIGVPPKITSGSEPLSVPSGLGSLPKPGSFLPGDKTTNIGNLPVPVQKNLAEPYGFNAKVGVPNISGEKDPSSVILKGSSSRSSSYDSSSSGN